MTPPTVHSDTQQSALGLSSEPSSAPAALADHPSKTSAPSAPILVTGATGYVGGRLVPLLLARGHTVRAAARDVDRLRCRPWATHPRVQLVSLDLRQPGSVQAALGGCATAYYLVHSMNPQGGDFAATDRAIAQGFVDAANASGLKRIIYLGGLGQSGDPALSHHLQSRAEVGAILGSGSAALTFLRAAVILGSGSASFEMLRYLTERLPVMLTPTWVRTRCQPIAISNVLEYLAGCHENPQTTGKTYDIGGPDIVTYEDLFGLYAQEAGLRRRLLIPVPMLSPRLSSLWLGLITPVPTTLAKPLVLGLRNEVVCQENAIRDIIPQRLLSCREAIRLAVDKVRQQAVETCWHDGDEALPPEWISCGDPRYAGGDVYEDGYRAVLEGPPEQVWPAVARLGGDNGWYYGDALWRLRGFMDTLAGGPGVRRGRRHPTELRPGDALDFWRVVRVDPPHVLLLHAEMRTPGEAMLQVRLTPQGKQRTELTMVLRFLPRGLAGHAYWWAMYPMHKVVFFGMFRSLAAASGLGLASGPSRYVPASEDVCPLR